jgi:hypothetical protein
VAIPTKLIGELLEGAGQIGKKVAGAAKKAAPAMSKLSSRSPLGVHGGFVAAAVIGGAAGVANGAKGTVADWANEVGYNPAEMNDYAVRSAFSGSKGRSVLAASTDGLTNSLSGGKSTVMKSINKRY